MRFLLLLSMLVLAGCASKEEKYIYIKTPCPKFEYKTNGIEFIDHNETYAIISHNDIKEIAKFAKERDDFNHYVDELNKGK